MARKIRNIMLYLNDIIESIEKINRYTDRLDFDNFNSDEKTIDAVVRNFEIIGEATNQISSTFRKKHPDIEWRLMIDFRNVIIHEYFGINKEIIWDIIQNELSVLKNKISEILEKEGNSIIKFEK